MAKKSADKVLTDAEMKRKFPQYGMASDIYLDADSNLWLPSRILAFNHMVGGGIPYGKIMEDFGEESTGKTLLAMDFGYVAQQCGGVVIWADAEASFDVAWAIKNGLNPKRVSILKDENLIEPISDFIRYQILYWRAKLQKNEPILLVLDSIAALDFMENDEVDAMDKKAEMGKRAKAIRDMFRTRNKMLSKYGIITICTNQLSKKIGASKYEDPDTTPGGTAMKYYAAQRIGSYRGKTLKDAKKRRVGMVTFWRTKKNKVAPPMDNVQGHCFYRGENLGFSKYVGLLDILIEKGVVERKKGVGILYKGKKICSAKTLEDGKMDESNFIEVIESNDKLRKNLIRRSGINTVSKFKEKLAGLTRNLYPVKTKKDEESN